MPHLDQHGLNFLKNEEGCRLSAYRDSVGVLTIGYGHTGKDVHSGLVWTQLKADNALRNDVTWAEQAVSHYVKVILTQNQFNALVSLTYNIGAGGFEQSKVHELLNEKRYNDAANAILNWAHPPELLDRRERERHMFLTK